MSELNIGTHTLPPEEGGVPSQGLTEEDRNRLGNNGEAVPPSDTESDTEIESSSDTEIEPSEVERVHRNQNAFRKTDIMQRVRSFFRGVGWTLLAVAILPLQLIGGIVLGLGKLFMSTLTQLAGRFIITFMMLPMFIAIQSFKAAFKPAS